MKDYMWDDEDWSRQKKREARRRRRVRNQILVGMTMLFLFAAAGIGIWHGMQKAEVQEQESMQQVQESQAKIEEILAKEEVIATPEPTPEPVQPTPEELLEEKIDRLLGSMPLEDKVAGLFVVTPEAITGVPTALQAGEATKQALEKYAVGGLIYFQKNIQSREQITEMLFNTQSYAKYPLFLAVDEEGGKVARVASAGIMQPVPGAGDIGATNDTESAYQAGFQIGSTLCELGFNVDFAPVADVANVEGSVMVGRSYGADAAVVSDFVIAMLQGLEVNGISGCLKHFPGLGCTTADTHQGMAFTERTEEQFWAEEFVTFQAGIDAGADLIMVGHMSAPNLTGNSEPCIFSEYLITGILRERMNYEGIVITDALNMGAISNYYGADEAAILALKAGCDMLLMPENFPKAYGGVLQAVLDGTISEERINDSLRRIYRIKYAAELLRE